MFLCMSSILYWRKWKNIWKYVFFLIFSYIFLFICYEHHYTVCRNNFLRVLFCYFYIAFQKYLLNCICSANKNKPKSNASAVCIYNLISQQESVNIHLDLSRLSPAEPHRQSKWVWEKCHDALLWILIKKQGKVSFHPASFSISDACQTPLYQQRNHNLLMSKEAEKHN